MSAALSQPRIAPGAGTGKGRRERGGGVVPDVQHVAADRRPRQTRGHAHFVLFFRHARPEAGHAQVLRQAGFKGGVEA